MTPKLSKYVFASKKLRKKHTDYARKLREELSMKTQGWDSKAIHEIVRKHYGSLLGFFEFQEWPERGKDMMLQIQSCVKNEFGGIQRFIELHRHHEGRLFSTYHPSNDENLFIKITESALTLKGEQTCKEVGLNKLRNKHFENDGTILVDSLDVED